MRKRLIWTAALSAVAVVAVAATAIGEVFTFGNIVLKADGGVTPKALPKNKLAPVTVEVSGDISTKDGTHPPSLREVVIDFDKNGTINAKGIPVCKQGQLVARSTKAAKAACPKAIVGKGSTKVVVQFAESNPFTAQGPLVLFNGGVKGGTTMMFLHAYVNVPAPTALIVPIKITKIKKGRYGTHTVSKPPVIAGGAGSAIHFDLKVNPNKTKYVTAKCSDGKFHAKVVKALFKDEAEATTGPPSTTVSGTVIRKCTPKG